MFIRLCLTCVATLCFTCAHGQFTQGIKADYYNGVNFHSFVLSRIEKNIGFSRELKSPAPGVGKEYFSIRYSGSITAPASGLYTFYVLADDGVRVRVNHQLIIDAWIDQEAATYSGSIILNAGEIYDLEIDYYNSIVHSVFSIRWELPSESYMFNLARQPIITAIPTHVLTPTRSQPKQRASLLVGRIAKQSPPPELKVAESSQTTIKKINNKRKSGIIVENEPIVLKTVVFDQQSASLKANAILELDNLVKFLKMFETKKIEISGYTDYLGDSTDNQILSEQRAKTIARYLVKGGIEESRITAQGFGSRFPLVVSKNVRDRQANRRVEFKIVD